MKSGTPMLGGLKQKIGEFSIRKSREIKGKGVEILTNYQDIPPWCFMLVCRMWDAIENFRPIDSDPHSVLICLEIRQRSRDLPRECRAPNKLVEV